MCVRFDQDTGTLVHWSKVVKAWIPYADWRDGLDAYPGYQAAIMIDRKGQRILVNAQWGMVPPWAKDAAFGKKNAYNARCETVNEKATFRSAFKSRRCVVPISAFYERMDGRWIRFRGQTQVLAVAGLWEPE